MKVSIVLPTYNRAHVLAEALESVFAQTYPDFELIVVDDGSTDETRTVISRFRDARLRYLQSLINTGCSRAMNRGMDESRGELISFLDSDDLWHRDKLAAEVGFLDAHPGVQAVFSDLEKYDGPQYFPSFMRASPAMSKILQGATYPEGIVLPQRAMYLCLLQEVPIKPTALTLRRNAVDATGRFNERWPSGSDWDFLIRFARCFSFGYIDRPLAVLRVQSDATHRLHFERDKLLMLDLLRSEARRASQDSEALRATREGMADIARHLGWFYLDRGRRAAAAKAYARGFRETGDGEFLLRIVFACLPDAAWRTAGAVFGRANLLRQRERRGLRSD